MKDPRFELGDFFQYRAQRRREAEAFVVSADESTAFVAVVERSWGQLAQQPASEHEPAAFAKVLDSTAAHERLSDSVLVRELLERLRTNRTEEGVAADCASLLLGKALGRTVGLGTPSVEAFDRASEIVDWVDLAWMTFEPSLEEAIGLDRARQDSWTAVLRDVTEPAGDYLERSDDKAFGWLTAIQTHTPEDVWRRVPHLVRLKASCRRRFKLVAQLDVGGLCEALERVPSHVIQRAILSEAELVQDEKLLLAALARAPTLFEGGLWTGRTVGLLLAEQIVRRVERLEEEVRRAVDFGSHLSSERRPSREDLESLRQKEIPQWLDSAFGSLLSRPDGRELAVEFAVELVRRTDSASLRSQRDERWIAEEAALDCLVQQLKKARVRLADLRDLWTRAREKWSDQSAMPYVLLAALLAETAEAVSDAEGRAAISPDEAWQWYVACLELRDSGIPIQVNPYGGAAPWVFANLGWVLAQNPDPLGCWRKAWSATANQRHRARFRPDDDRDRDLLAASSHLVRVGRETLVPLRDRGAQDVVAQLWRCLRTATEQLMLGNVWVFEKERRFELAVLFAYLPHVLSGSWAEAVREAAPMLRVNDEVCLLSASLLVQNGLSAPAVEALYRGIDCDPIAVKARLSAWLTAAGLADKSDVDIDALTEPFSALHEDDE